MDTFLNTYLPWGIIAVIIIACFCINFIDAGKKRDSSDPFEHTGFRKFEFTVIVGAAIGAILSYSVIPIPILWGVSAGMAFGFAAAILKRSRDK